MGTGIRNVYKYSKAYSGNDFVSICEDDTFKTIVPIPDFAPVGILANIDCEEVEKYPVNCTVNDNLPVNCTANCTVNCTAKNPEYGILSNLDKQIILLLTENNKITYDLLAEQLGKSRRTIIYHIHNLVSKGIITRIGADKNGYWKVN